MCSIAMDTKHSIINGLNYTCEKYFDNDHNIMVKYNSGKSMSVITIIVVKIENGHNNCGKN